jgi:hypothetical protein
MSLNQISLRNRFGVGSLIAIETLLYRTSQEPLGLALDN